MASGPGERQSFAEMPDVLTFEKPSGQFDSASVHEKPVTGARHHELLYFLGAFSASVGYTVSPSSISAMVSSE